MNADGGSPTPRASVGELVFPESTGVIDEAGGEHDAALLIYQRIAARPQPVVVTIDAQPELLGASQR